MHISNRRSKLRRLELINQESIFEQFSQIYQDIVVFPEFGQSILLKEQYRNSYSDTENTTYTSTGYYMTNKRSIKVMQ